MLFLSKDRKLQVSACTTLSGWEVFCVEDFIRQIANLVKGQNNTIIYYHILAGCAGEVDQRGAYPEQYSSLFCRSVQSA